MSSSSAALSTPEGAGSVSGAPHLPAGFTDTFTSRYIYTSELRLHAVLGGEGRRCCMCARLARELVRRAPADAGAGPGLRGHRRRPAGHGAVPTNPRAGTTPAPRPATQSR